MEKPFTDILIIPKMLVFWILKSKTVEIIMIHYILYIILFMNFKTIYVFLYS